MLDMSAAALEMVKRSYTIRLRVDSWLGDDLLAAEVPVSGGEETGDRSLSVPESITLTVPRLDRGESWDPVENDHPLGSDGQRLHVSLGVDLGLGETEWIERGWFLITSSATEGDTVTVQGKGLLQLIDEARFVSPFEPSGTFSSTVRSLVEPALTVDIDAGLTDRNVPVGLQWDEDRLGGLNEILSAWPAIARVNENGTLSVKPPPTTFSSVLAVTDDPKTGTVVQWQSERTRDGAFNIVVARGEDANGLRVQGAVFDLAAGSPKRWGGPFNPLPVPYLFESPLLTTSDQCFRAARTILDRKRRQAARKLAATLVPHPGLVLGDVVTVTGPPGVTGVPATVEQLNLPYGPDAMTLGTVTL